MGHARLYDISPNSPKKLDLRAKFNHRAAVDQMESSLSGDHKIKIRLRQYPKLSGLKAALAFKNNGTKLAVGVSYLWDEGDEGMAAGVTPWVGVRTVGDEVKPKSMTT
ncbi:hypothetical protein BJ165DRAFT_1534358 [Panaeolus papilionaceus]|nr:hypothetical protein BJ165DRAFT_1534358 [Panaeolus papilionaceus]